MTTWHCDKCSLRFGTYADFGDHWRTDHRNDPITERIVSAWQDTPRPDDFTSAHGLPDQNAEPEDTCGICGNPKRTGQNNFGTHQCPPY